MLQYNATFIILTVLSVIITIENFNTPTTFRFFSLELFEINTAILVLIVFLMGFIMGVFRPTSKTAPQEKQEDTEDDTLPKLPK